MVGEIVEDEEELPRSIRWRIQLGLLNLPLADHVDEKEHNKTDASCVDTEGETRYGVTVDRENPYEWWSAFWQENQEVVGKARERYHHVASQHQQSPTHTTKEDTNVKIHLAEQSRVSAKSYNVDIPGNMTNPSHHSDDNGDDDDSVDSVTALMMMEMAKPLDVKEGKRWISIPRNRTGDRAFEPWAHFLPRTGKGNRLFQSAPSW